MILNKTVVYDAVWSYKNSTRKSNEEMADLLGLKSRQGFKSMMENQTMSLDHLINFCNKAGKSLSEVFGMSQIYDMPNQVKESDQGYSNKTYEERISALESKVAEFEEFQGMMGVYFETKERIERVESMKAEKAKLVGSKPEERE